MDQSATFARHFARLVSLLLHDESNIDEQKVSLRALVTLSQSGAVTLSPDELSLRANGVAMANALTGVHDVASQLTAHSITRVEFGAGSTAADLLGVARIVAAKATPGDGGVRVRKKLAALKPRTITFATAEATRERSLSEAPTVPVPIADTRTDAATPDAAAVLARLAGPHDVSALEPEEVFAALDRATNVDVLTRVLDDCVLLVEHCVRTGKQLTVVELLHGVVSRDATIRDGDAERKRAYVLAIRRVSKPAVLRAVASLILKRPAGRQQYYDILERAGEEGADAVIEQINQAASAEEKKALVELFRQLTDAVPALRRMLGDSRWFVVRNAADLLGEVGAPAAENDLIAVLRHSDDRVRRAATSALLRLGTPNAMHSVYDAVNDASPEVRMEATAAIATQKNSRTSTTLIRAIEEERDADVQLAMIAALGKVGTPDAVQKLIRMAEPNGRLFRKRQTSLRTAAVHALGVARTPAALSALQALASDKEREVRDTASRALAQTAR